MRKNIGIVRQKKDKGTVLRNLLQKLFFSLLLCVCFTLQAAAADTLVADMKETYNNMNAFEGTFTQTQEHMESGATETRQGTLSFAKPLNIYWETFEPEAELLIVNADAVWNYLPEEGVAYKYSPEVVHDSQSMLQVITGQSRLDQDFEIKHEKDVDDMAILRLYPHEPTMQMVEVLLHVDKKTKLLRRVELTDFYGNTNDIVFETLTPQKDIAQERFSFTAPKDITVEDLTDSTLPQRDLLQ